jgi:hypothetical protein
LCYLNLQVSTKCFDRETASGIPENYLSSHLGSSVGLSVQPIAAESVLPVFEERRPVVLPSELEIHYGAQRVAWAARLMQFLKVLLHVLRAATLHETTHADRPNGEPTARMMLT